MLFFVTMMLAILSQAIKPYGTGMSIAWAVVLFGPILLVTIYIHELCHCLAANL